jgi:MFS family permease
MIRRIQSIWNLYPRQFWLLFFGLLISTLGASMIWPFLMIYVSERLELPLTTTTSLMTINASMGLMASFVAGPLIDRAGRKWVMAVSLAVNGLSYLMMSHAASLPAFAVLMGLSGAFNPLYRVGADAMMADLIPAEKRIDAYSLLRTSNNVGVAIGPAVGGLIAATSYTVAFYCAAAGMLTYSLLVIFLASETMPSRSVTTPLPAERFGGYGRVLRDRQFLSFAGTFILTQMAAAMVWVLLGVYVKENFGIVESRYGLLPMTNALMVVFFQVSVTQLSKRHPPLSMLSLGSLIYAVALGGIALGRGFSAFWISMVVLTIGELILSPTATSFAANLAPVDMRGRYMSLYGLTWSIALGTGPLLGGLLNDNFGANAIWYGGAIVGGLSSLFFLLLARRSSRGIAYAHP